MVGHFLRAAGRRDRAIAPLAFRTGRGLGLALAIGAAAVIAVPASGARAFGSDQGKVELELAPPVALLQPGIVFIPPVGDAREVDVYFDWDQSELKDRGKQQVTDFARRLLAWGGGVNMTVIGHTDRSGSEAYNIGLSQRRAIAVREELMALGVSADVIGVQWKGETDLAVPTADGVRLEQNRRTFIRLELDVKQQAAGARSGWTAFRNNDYHAAMQAWQPLAVGGLPAAMTYVGYFHENGLGVPVDRAKAADYYRQAAAKGDPVAANRLGVMLATGRGVDKDEASAVAYFRKAADAGLPIAHLNLGVMQQNGLGMPASEPAAIKSYLAAVDGGETRAATNLGALALAKPGHMLDDRSAAEWFRLAAMDGDAVAQNNLGVMHATGQDVPRDHVRALAWLEMAADVMPVEAYADDFWTDEVARASLVRFYRTARANRDAMRELVTSRQQREAIDLAGEWTRSMAALR